ncbi:MAG: right-handed parallel beta-helix repeat-containing protein, partial [Planctomycetota bacterium]
MKKKRSFLNFGILVLIIWVAGFGVTPYAMAHSIGNIVMTPQPPADLTDGDPVTVRFTYITEEERGVRIFAVPYTKGQVTQGAEVYQSQLYPVGKGQGSASFTVNSQDIRVDQIQLVMTTADQSRILLEHFVGAIYFFYAHNLTNIVMVPPSPAARLNNEYVNITFDYGTTEAGGVRIYARPFTDGSLTPNWNAHGSILYPVGNGSGTGYFRITSGDVIVDQVRFQIKNADSSVVLREIFVPVEYHYGNSITNINLVPPSPATLMPNDPVNITFDYAAGDAGGVRIWTQPFSNGSLTPGQVFAGSPILPAGHGSGARFFTITSGNVVVDQVRVYMMDAPGNVLLWETFIDVEYRFCDGTCVWHVDADAPGANIGRNWTDAFNDLQDALAVAAPGDMIKVAEGTYKPDQGGGQTPGDITATFDLIDDVVIEGGYGGFGEPDPDARDTETYETILSGDLQGNDGPGFTNNADNSHHVVRAVISGGGAVLDGFTITAGNAVGLNPTGQGGGIYIGLGSPILVNCTFIRNKAARGGGASNMGSSSDNPTFIQCKFIGNLAGVGGAMESQRGEPSLTNCVLSGNVATSLGGGLLNMGTSDATMTNCTLSGNSAGGTGGGVYCSYATASVTVLNCILWSNSDSGGSDESAQIHIGSGPPVVVVDYSCIEGLSGGLGGTGNIGDDPWFVDADGADDVVGTEDDDVHLLEGSPCIDTGHPGLIYQDVDGSRNDMGAYGGPFGEVYEPFPHPGFGFIITNIGNIPTSDGNDPLIGRDGNEPNVGLANVSSAASGLFGIPAYKDSPFGRTLRVKGQFGLYDDVDFYQIMIAPWDDTNEPAPEDYVVLDDEWGGLPLGKTRWYKDANGHTKTEYVKLGPKTIDGKEYLYLLNQAGDGSIWSNYDLRIRWNTKARENGIYTLTYKAYRW